jgi:3'(2'), 5'-bisphosphate nucleotidase
VRRDAEVALAAALEAADLVMRVYAAPFDVEYKAKDDPVTRADKESNALLCERLARVWPGIPIVAEESDPRSYAGFGQAEAAWFVDPLDGTREFVAHNGEFAVMVGLAERGRATIGVVVAPAWGRAFVGVVGEGAWEIAPGGRREAIRVSSREALAGATVVVSRSRTPTRVSEFVVAVAGRPPVVHGSSGLKGALVALGEADVYLQPGNAGMRWDACATDALVRAAGGELTESSGAHYNYASAEIANARGMIASNGKLHPALLEELARAGNGGPRA